MIHRPDDGNVENPYDGGEQPLFKDATALSLPRWELGEISGSDTGFLLLVHFLIPCAENFECSLRFDQTRGVGVWLIFESFSNLVS